MFHGFSEPRPPRRRGRAGPPGKAPALADPGGRDPPPESDRLGSVAHEEERDVSAIQEPESTDERVEPLDGVEPRDRAEHGPVGRQAETRARERRRRQALVLLVEVDAVHHGRASPGRGEAEPLRLRRLRRGNVDRRVGPAREAPLEAEVEPLEGARVALVVDAVERVDGGRSGPPRGQTPVKPGALAVGVDDLDPEAADQADGCEQRTGAEAARRDFDDGEGQGAPALEEGAVAGPGHGDLELAPRKTAREVVHLTRPAAGRGRSGELEDTDQASACETDAAPSPWPGRRYSSRGGAKMSRTTQRRSSVRPPWGTCGGVCQKSPAFT